MTSLPFARDSLDHTPGRTEMRQNIKIIDPGRQGIPTLQAFILFNGTPGIQYISDIPRMQCFCCIKD